MNARVAAVCNPQPCAPRKPVFDELVDTANRLDERLDTLEKRLEAILRPAMPSAQRIEDESSTIRGLAHRLDSASERLNRFIERIDL